MTNISRASLKPPHKGMNKDKTVEIKKGSRLTRILAAIFTIGVILVLIDGWIGRFDSDLTPERGAGYWYGIIGGVMMLLLILYPAVKHKGWSRFLGKPKFWYPLHVVFGVAGPVFVLFHANFSFGSPNSRNATIAMLMVAISGLVGRYLHQKVYSVLTDYKNSVEKYKQKLEEQQELMLKHFGLEARHKAAVSKLDDYVDSKSGFWAHLIAMPVVAVRSRKMKRVLISTLKLQLYKSTACRDLPAKKKRAIYRKFKSEIKNYYYSLRKYFGFSVYERMLAVWSVFHFPMFFVLIFLSILHVVIVHMY